MKSKIIEILDNYMEPVCADGEGMITEKSIQHAAEAITQVVCDREAQLMYATIRSYMHDTDTSRDYCLRHTRNWLMDKSINSFTEEQVNKAIEKMK